ncbi:FHA domain-containing protein [Streptomyces sp. NPDC018610]|uniref:FHA domain-containing protein n=1 Tax=Streptomyces sp. NPDC018610 TaxID=3365049 RepID=UPI00379E3327
MKVAGGVMDVSNVCWSDRLTPVGRHFPLLKRLFLVRDAWHREYGADTPLALVADNSLWRLLRSDERATLERMRRAGEIRMAPTADPVLLSLAQRNGWHVVSMDQFVDLRRDHPWIEHSPQRFLAWETHNGRVDFRLSGIRPRAPQAVTRAMEDKTLKFEQKLDPRDSTHQAVLDSHWRCVNPQCFKARYWPDRLHDWPVLSRAGTPMCGGCRTRVEKVGPRTRPRSFVALDAATGREFLRFPVAEDDALEAGRGALRHGINLAAGELDPPERITRLSRRHLLLAVERTPNGSRVTAADLGSGNGTVLRRNGADRPLEPGEFVSLREQDRLVLADVVTLRLSGKRYFTDEQQARPRLSGAGGGLTVLG